MSRTSTTRTYGRRTATRTKPPVLFSNKIPLSPTDRKSRQLMAHDDFMDDLTEQFTFVTLDEPTETLSCDLAPLPLPDINTTDHDTSSKPTVNQETPAQRKPGDLETPEEPDDDKENGEEPVLALEGQTADNSELLDSFHEDSIQCGLRILSWSDVCPPGDHIEKIAEASYAEVYRVTNARGTSIIKAIRLSSPVKAQTKQQIRSRLVDEEPHDEEDLRGELTISEWLADIPGFVVYKERYIVKGRAPKELLETHQTFHRRAKRQDPGRLQFYPSPSRYLDGTQFLVIELGDAGRALEDMVMESVWQLWDVFLNVAIALARAENQIQFEHRDLHEGNLCVRQVVEPCDKPADDHSPIVFGYSGLDITILDYGLSRAGGGSLEEDGEPIAFDLEKDLSLFTSTHAAQCKVYRQMRSYFLKGDRTHLPPSCHQQPYDEGPDGRPISWKDYSPYTNVLWLAYLYGYLVRSFSGDKKQLAMFKRTSRELWLHINPDAPPAILSFSSATDVVRFAVESGWLTQDQLAGSGTSEDSYASISDDEDDYSRDESRLYSYGTPDVSVCGHGSIIEAQVVERDDSELRRSPRRRRPVVRYC